MACRVIEVWPAVTICGIILPTLGIFRYPESEMALEFVTDLTFQAE
jgi:hypothetical protein